MLKETQRSCTDFHTKILPIYSKAEPEQPVLNLNSSFVK